MLKLFKGLFAKERIVHDYTRRYWGHDYIFYPKENGMKARIEIFGGGFEKGEFLLLEKDGDVFGTCYHIDNVSHYLDPADMWSIEATFSPRSQKEKAADVENFKLGRKNPWDLSLYQETK